MFAFIQQIEIPDGHRAPLPDTTHRTSSTRSVDTQTPSGALDPPTTPTISVDDASSGSGSHSGSPAIPIIPGQMDSSRPSSGADSSCEKTEKGTLYVVGKLKGSGCEQSN